jgi:hypothetical protein
MILFRSISLSCAVFGLLLGIFMNAAPANAVIYCKTVGVLA